MRRTALAFIIAGLLVCVVAIIAWWVDYVQKSIMG